MALQIENINKSFGGDVVLNDISLTASDNEKIGLIGSNGAGKTTLLKIIAGDIPFDGGRILTPKNSAVGYLRQNSFPDDGKTIDEYMTEAFEPVVKLGEEIRVLEERMSTLSGSEYDKILKSYGAKSELFEKRGGFEIKMRIDTILFGMGFASFDRGMKIKDLSGGEKTKLSMARLLLENPDVLLLDEPTNHLDFKTMQWLEQYLKGCRSIVIAVSHDRYFLDSLVDTIYEIDKAKITRYTGNYSAYLAAKKQNDALELKRYNAHMQEVKKLETYIAENGVRASTAKSAKSKQKALNRLPDVQKPASANPVCRFKFESVYRSYKDVLSVENVTLKVPEGGVLKTLAQNISFDVKRGEKVAVVGANGIGKTTLLKSIIERHEYFGGAAELGGNVKVGYYDQEQRLLCDEKTVFSEISDRFPLMDEVDIRSALALVLFRDEDVFKSVKTLSGGERARLMFLVLMLEKPNFLILDEPTNHLDLPAKEALDSALEDYDGTVLFVSHDRYFLNKTADKILELSESGITVYNGNYDSYIDAAGITAASKPSAGGRRERANDYEAQRRRQADIRNTSKKADIAEERIHAVEEKISELDLKLNESGSDFDAAKKLFEERMALEAELDSLYELWSALSDKLKSLGEKPDKN